MHLLVNSCSDFTKCTVQRWDSVDEILVWFKMDGKPPFTSHVDLDTFRNVTVVAFGTNRQQ